MNTKEYSPVAKADSNFCTTNDLPSRPFTHSSRYATSSADSAEMSGMSLVLFEDADTRGFEDDDGAPMIEIPVGVDEVLSCR